ncbi:MAG: hypothetical protein E6767_19320 [Dysgonomonas sp.]|nr:hypothetical protein [Dysgonomonas sp.]
MDSRKTITGPEAIELMRRTKLVPGATFGIRFITCDLNRAEYGQIRVYEACELRSARKNEGLSVDPDHYLYFTDVSTDQPRQCFKKLIRAVCFPPSQQWLTVKWFT